MPVALQRLWIQLTADRKKLGVLCAAMAVGLLLWARLILTSNVPRTAVANEELQAASYPADSAEDPMVVRRPDPVPILLDTSPARDPFVISTLHFSPLATEDALRSVTGKSDSQRADEVEESADQRLATLRSLVSRFRLEAAMSGAGIGVISGHTARVGDMVPAVGNPEIKFELIEVNHRSVRLRFEEEIFDLHMMTPGE